MLTAGQIQLRQNISAAKLNKSSPHSTVTGRQTKTQQEREGQREDFVFRVISLGLTHHATDLTENNTDTSWPISNRAP